MIKDLLKDERPKKGDAEKTEPGESTKSRDEEQNFGQLVNNYSLWFTCELGIDKRFHLLALLVATYQLPFATVASFITFIGNVDKLWSTCQ